MTFSFAPDFTYEWAEEVILQHLNLGEFRFDESNNIKCKFSISCEACGLECANIKYPPFNTINTCARIRREMSVTIRKEMPWMFV